MNFVGPEPIAHEPTDREDGGVARSELNTSQAGTPTDPQIVDGIEVISHPLTCIRRRYKMAYVPSGFWSRLISRLMINLKRSGLVESEGAGKHTPSMTYWRRGILVGHSTGKFLVEAIQAGTKKGGWVESAGLFVGGVSPRLHMWYGFVYRTYSGYFEGINCRENAFRNVFADLIFAE